MSAPRKKGRAVKLIITSGGEEGGRGRLVDEGTDLMVVIFNLGGRLLVKLIGL